jgi:hypothetical protein
MSDWAYLNKCRQYRGQFASDVGDGFNGAFSLVINGLKIKVIASDGMGWQHVSVSIHNSTFTPSWDVMCKVKDLFWEPEDAVIQIHPPAKDYVNFHPGCLHLWRCTDGREQPLPHWIMVGPKT